MECSNYEIFHTNKDIYILRLEAAAELNKKKGNAQFD